MSRSRENTYTLGVWHANNTFPPTRSDVLPKTKVESILNDTVIRHHHKVSTVEKYENGISVKQCWREIGESEQYWLQHHTVHLKTCNDRPWIKNWSSMNALLEIIKIPQMIEKFPTVFNEGWWLNIFYGGPALDFYLPRSLQSSHINHALLISNFRRVLNVVCFLLGNSPASEFYMPTFRNNLFHLHRQVGVKND